MIFKYKYYELMNILHILEYLVISLYGYIICVDVDKYYEMKWGTVKWLNQGQFQWTVTKQTHNH